MQRLWDVLLANGVDPTADGWNILTEAVDVSANGTTIIGRGVRNGSIEGFVASIPAVCGAGLIADCNGHCAPISWLGDGICDNGAYTYNGELIWLNCEQFTFDGGDCAGEPDLPEPVAHTPPSQPEYTPPPPAPEKTHVVVLVHGRGTNAETFNDLWVPMADEIGGRLGPEWIAFAHNWTQNSQHPPQTILSWAADEGTALGKVLASGNYEHVHLVGYSAGAQVITSAAFRIKHPDGNPFSAPTSTVVHTTYLDAYVGLGEFVGAIFVYGSFSDWSDHYFSREPNLASALVCYGPEECATTWLWTQQSLAQCFNVDVSFLHDAYSFLCKSTHAWPRCFYRYSAEPTPSYGCSDCGVMAQCCNAPDEPFAQYGFGLSKEVLGESWATAVAAYTRGLTVELGSSEFDGDEPAESDVFRIRQDAALPMENLPASSSGNGSVVVAGNGFTANTAGIRAPGSAWLTVQVAPSAITNFLSFDLEFTSTVGATALLTVYIDGAVIGTFDERNAEAGLTTKWLFMEADLVAGSTHTLSFRLDQFGRAPSSVNVTGVATGRGTFVSPGDLNVDDIVNGADLGTLLGSWGACPGCAADLDGDGVVSGADLATLLGSWGAGS